MSRSSRETNGIQLCDVEPRICRVCDREGIHLGLTEEPDLIVLVFHSCRPVGSWSYRRKLPICAVGASMQAVTPSQAGETMSMSPEWSGRPVSMASADSYLVTSGGRREIRFPC